MSLGFCVGNHGSIFLLQPLTDDARRWIEDHLPENAQTFCTSTVVDARYIGAIVCGIQQDGLTVKGGSHVARR